MEAEHCIKAGFDYQFTSGNYNITTTPSFEWRLVAAREGKSEEEWAALREEGEFGQADMGHGRRILDVGELWRSKTSVSAKLARCEVVAVVLYTGPMVSAHPLFSGGLLFFCTRARGYVLAAVCSREHEWFASPWPQGAMGYTLSVV